MSEDKNLKDAQYRKSLSISFFNATNNAIEMAKFMTGAGKYSSDADPELTAENTEVFKKNVKTFRDWLLSEHADYYAKTIANVGVAYRAEDTINDLKSAKTMDELKQKFLNLSEDERRDGEIIKCVAELKATLKQPIAKVEGETKIENKPQNETTRQNRARKPRVAPSKKGKGNGDNA